MKCFHANDISKDALDILMDQESNISHVFSGLLESLSEDEQQRVASMRPPKASKKAKAASCHGIQLQYLKSCQADLFPCSARATNCLKHPGQSCPLFFPIDEEADGVPPLRINFSGPMCTPWTSQGMQLGDADPSMESFHLWVLKMANSSLDLVYLENSDKFPWELFRNNMEQNGPWQCLRVVFSAEERVGEREGTRMRVQ